NGESTMKVLFAIVTLVVVAQPAWSQGQLVQGASRYEADGPPERKERCRAAAAAMLQAPPQQTPSQADLERGLWAVRRCEVSGVPALISVWSNPNSDYRTRALNILVRVTQEIHDRRLLRLMQSTAADVSEPDLVRFAALSVLTDYLRPGRSPNPDQWFSPDDPGMLQASRRNHVEWVIGEVPIDEADLRALRPTLEEIAARVGDPAQLIAKWMIQLIPGM
ncbi:MAG TPA: hypothetical protein VMN60_05145, partial [Longimicrobiales bacterium]|nr:hypothetical protein [Longimicrobiales bacterium]